MRGSFFLNVNTITTDTGYVKMAKTKTYAAKLGPGSNAMADNPAKKSHGTSRINQRTSRNSVTTLVSSAVSFFTYPVFSPSAFRISPLSIRFAAEACAGSVEHISSKLQTWSVNPASIAGVMRSVECVR